MASTIEKYTESGQLLTRLVLKKMGHKTPRRVTIIRAFFKDGYSVQTISAFYKIEIAVVEDHIRKYCKQRNKQGQ